ncbi:MAG: sulfotransferase family 2 domain-containing protein [Verrucomicrobiae bacterium]|nr:sulfotransferase family 2 domain-containing protein [Verrucomicrobiae bacterium]
MKEFICWCHIPKTAGSTFRHILFRNLGRTYLFPTHGLYEESVKPENIRSMLKRGPRFCGVGGHRVSLALPYDLKRFNVLGIAHTRNPVDRFLSEYFYLRKISKESIIADAKNVEDFIERIKATPGRIQEFFERQTISIGISRTELKERMENGQIHLFPCERFDESLVLLKKQYPGIFKDVSYKARNVNKSRPSTVAESVKDEIRELSPQDTELYQMSMEYLDHQLASHFTKEELESELKKLRFRCRIRALFLDNLISISAKAYNGLNRCKI